MRDETYRIRERIQENKKREDVVNVLIHIYIYIYMCVCVCECVCASETCGVDVWKPN